MNSVTSTVFLYGEKETAYLKSKDKKLSSVIDHVGHIDRACQSDLFEAVVNAIVGQQISTKAHQSIWGKIKSDNPILSPKSVFAMPKEKLQSYGLSWRKVDYITDLAEKIVSGAFSPESLLSMSDEEAITALTSLRGVGIWTAEMILIFCLQRPNVFSFGDYGIKRGLRMLYRHKEITPILFERYRRRFSPFCSVASLYLWAVAGGAIPELTDPFVSVKKRRKQKMDTL